MTIATYVINGMTCGHCVSSVSTELGRLPGVREVRVDLAAGTATVTSDQPLDLGSVREAVDQAGYEIMA